MQTKAQSLYESCCNTASGFMFSYLLAFLIYPLFGMQAKASTYFGVTVIYTVASVTRNFVVRRWFNKKVSNDVSAPTEWFLDATSQEELKILDDLSEKCQKHPHPLTEGVHGNEHY